MFPTQYEATTNKRESTQYYETICKLIEEFTDDESLSETFKQLFE